MAHARRQDTKAITSLYREQKDTLDNMMRSVHDCACMVARPLFDALWKEGLCVDAMGAVPPPVVAKTGPLFLNLLLSRVRELYRLRKTAETRLGIELIRRALRCLPDGVYMIPPEYTRELDRRDAQCLKAEGLFGPAQEAFQKLASDSAHEDIADVYTDLGMTRGGFRWLNEIVAPSAEEEVSAVLSRLENGKAEYAEALIRAGEGIANIFYVMGVKTLLEGKYEEAERHLEKAYHRMSRRVVIYRQTQVYSRAQLYYACSVLLNEDEAQFQNAISILTQLVEDLPASSWPHWLVAKSIDECLNYGASGASELIQFLGAHCPQHLDRYISDLDLLKRSEPLQEHLRRVVADPSRRQSERWSAARSLVLFQLDRRDIEGAGTSLDIMEELAAASAEFRLQFLEFLDGSSNYDPAWAEADAVFVMACMHELDGNYLDACTCLLRAFHQSMSDSDFEFAGSLLDRIEGYGLDPSFTQDARARLDAGRKKDESASPADDKERLRRYLAERGGMRLLFVGGNETQKRQDDAIREMLATEYPKLEVVFIHTGWSSNWGVQLSSIKGQLPQANGVVLMRFMRTELGRKLRDEINKAGMIWTRCAGHGRDSCYRAIVNCAMLAHRMATQ